uniref:Chromo domain-containing protein n=1 Tax=Strongyloides stercoralis TaxID=6248 RepID=A0A0K0DWF7_STRER
MAKRRRDLSVSSDIYVVEEILAKKKENGATFYKVKWEGYPVSKSTWEPEKNISVRSIKKYEKTISKDTSFSHPTNSESNSHKVDTPLRKVRRKSSYEGEEISPNNNVIRRSSRRLSKLTADNNTTLESNKLNSSKSKSSDTVSENMSIVKKVNKSRKSVTTPEEISYVVEKIVDHRVRNDGIKEYRIRWAGYSQEDDTWQTLDTFNDPHFVAMYEKSVADKVVSEKIPNGFLNKLMEEANSGKKYKESDISNVLTLFVNEKNEKLYLILLKSNDFALLKSTDIPRKFKKQCSIVDGRALRL